MCIGNIHLFAPKFMEKNKKYTCVNNIDDLNAMLYELKKRSDNKKMAVITEGPYTIPIYEGNNQ